MRFSRAVWSLLVLVLLLSACAKAEPAEPAEPEESASVAVAVDVDEFFDNLIEAQLTQTSYSFETTMTGVLDSTMSGVMNMGDTMSEFAFDQELSMVIDGEPVILREILVDDVFYAGFDVVTGDMFVAQPREATDDDDPWLDMFGGSYLAQMYLEMLRRAVVSITDEGDGGVIDGVGTRKYTIVLDASKFLGEDDLELLYESEALKEGSPPETTSVMWVGTDGNPRRSVTDYGGLVEDNRWFDWGVPVTITAPSPDEITEEWTLDELFGE